MNKTGIKIEGKFVNLRDVEVEDAKFILSLRCDEKKSRFLHKTEYDLKKQEEYIKKYKTLDNEWYFIIENKNGESLGTTRIYDLREDSFCIGSWLLKNGTAPQEMLEGDYLMRTFGFEHLKMDKIHFDVRKGNTKVLRYHKLTGAKIVGETDLDYLFECTKDEYLKNISKFIN
jgi:RimJ/RimL family protein N-acetyltransferase